MEIPTLSRTEWLKKVEYLFHSEFDGYACRKCGSPVLKTLKCFFCGDYNPYWTKEEEKEWEKKYATKQKS
jgi:hypothetical protein